MQHVEPFPLRGKLPASLIEGSLCVGELAVQEVHLTAKVVDVGVDRR